MLIALLAVLGVDLIVLLVFAVLTGGEHYSNVHYSLSQTRRAS